MYFRVIVRVTENIKQGAFSPVSLIEFYFQFGLKYKDIASLLEFKYGFQISEC